MNKQQLLIQVIAELEKNLDMLIATAIEAKEAATSEESKAENKYDTRGLEASYLAGAQAKRAAELKHQIKALKEIEIQNYSDQASKIAVTSLVEVQTEDDKKWFFLLPFAGGLNIKNEVQVLTPSSPLGKSLIGQEVGGYFELRTNKQTKEYEILNIL